MEDSNLFQEGLSAFDAAIRGQFLEDVLAFIPELLMALVVLVIGWWISSWIGSAIAQILKAVKLDKAADFAQVSKVFSKAGFKFSFSKFLGEIVKWFLIVITLITSLDILGLDRAIDILQTVVIDYIPNVIVASAVLVIAAFISEGVKHFVEGSAKAMGAKSARFAASVAKWAIWILAILIALGELGIGEGYMLTMFIGIISMLALAGGLAFGLGGKEAAARALEKISDSVSHKE
jgi:hypothetical protein